MNRDIQDMDLANTSAQPERSPLDSLPSPFEPHYGSATYVLHPITAALAMSCSREIREQRYERIQYLKQSRLWPKCIRQRIATNQAREWLRTDTSPDLLVSNYVPEDHIVAGFDALDKKVFSITGRLK